MSYEHLVNRPLDTPTRPLYGIFPLYDYWAIDAWDNRIFHEVKGEPGNRRLIIQWDKVKHYVSGSPLDVTGTAGDVTFQAILYEADGTIVFNYKDLDIDVQLDPEFPNETAWDKGASATVGISGGDGIFGGRTITISVNSEHNWVGTGKSIRFSLVNAADWTVMVYMAGDNESEASAIAAINQMEIIGSSDDVNVVVQLDRIDGYDDTNGDWTDTRRGLVIQDSDTSVIGSSLASIGEVNMGRPQALADFVGWGTQNFPAKRYALILWDHHGGGIDGLCYDETDHNDRLTLAEVRDGLSSPVDDGVYGVRVEVLAFDASFMGMIETAYEMADHAYIMVASEVAMPSEGLPYDAILADLVANPSQTQNEWATSIVARYAESYDGGGALSAVNVFETSYGGFAFPTALDKTLHYLFDTWEFAPVAEALVRSQKFGPEGNFRDLTTFFHELGTLALGTDLAYWALATEALLNDDIIIASHSGPGVGANGLSVYFKHLFHTKI